MCIRDRLSATGTEATAARGKRWNNPSIWNGRIAPWAGGDRGFVALRQVADGGWPFSSAVQSSPVGIVTSWPMNASGKRMIIEPCDGRARSGGGWGGVPG